MNSFSVGIPTLWRSHYLFESLQQLKDNPYVREVIIIDNDRSRAPNKREILFSKKFKIIEPDENLMVARSWNLLVESSTSNLVCLLNDDIVLNDNVFLKLQETNFDEIGIVGLKEDSIRSNPDYSLPVELIHTQHRTHSFGCCMFFNKKNYVPIPETLRVFFTDDWIFVNCRDIIKKNNYVIQGFIKGVTSITATEFQHTYHRDGEVFYSLLRELGLN